MNLSTEELERKLFIENNPMHNLMYKLIEAIEQEHYEFGYNSGRDDGYRQGEREGYDRGYQEGSDDALGTTVS